MGGVGEPSWAALLRRRAVWLVAGCFAAALSGCGPEKVRPTSFDSAIDTVVWNQVAQDHLRRVHHAAVYDGLRHRMVVFGGLDQSGDTLADTWEWDGTEWTKPEPPLSPPARSENAMSFDRARGRTVLFGGQDQLGNLFSDTWEWDGTSWTERAPSVSPPARTGHAMVFGSSTSVLFGGYGQERALDDTWEWDGTNWTPRLPSQSPPARYHHAMAYDRVRDRAVLSGGTDSLSNSFGDTWEWDGTSWNQPPANSNPAAPVSPSMAFDETRGVTVSFSGSVTAEWDGTTWSQAMPTTTPFRTLHSMIYDSARGRTLAFGGYASYSTTTMGDAWEWDGSSWTSRTAGISPGLQNFVSMAYDSARSRIVLAAQATWEWDGSSWLQRTAAMAPTLNRQQTAVAYDSARGVTVLFGGGPGKPYTQGDTWEWDGTTWTQRLPTISPLPRFEHAMAYDGGRKVTLLFGGGDGNGVGFGNPLGDTWQWDGTIWSQLTPATSASARVGHRMVYQRARDRVLLFGGLYYDASTSTYRPIGDTWEWDGTLWALQAPVHSPSPRYDFQMAYDPLRGRAILFGGTDGTGTFGDTWEWDGTDWSERANSGPSTAYATLAALAFDIARGQAVLYLGGETWLYHARGGACAGDSDCEATSCVDGVCCEQSSCGTCQSCDGPTPGLCTPVVGADPDSCATPKVCGAAGCGAPAGSACAVGSVCASGFCVQGVCCDRLCNGPCDACAQSRGAQTDGTCFTPATCAAGKNLGAPCQTDGECATHHCTDKVCCAAACDGPCQTCDLVPGTCTPALANSDPRGSCAGERACGGTCDGAGACQFPQSGTRCDTCKSCDGAGRCDQLPADEDDQACGTISCAALSTECAAFNDLTTRRCAGLGLCAAPNESSSCTSQTLAPDGQTCSGGTCQAGVCTPAEVAPPPPAASGCELAATGSPLSSAALLVLLLLLGCRRRAIAVLLLAFGCGPRAPAELRAALGSDGAVWTQALITPSGRTGAAMAYEPARGRTLMFGGIDNKNQNSNETWEWDGTAWSRLAPPTSPSPRRGMALSYDDSRDRVVMFGDTDQLGDTWEWDGTTWTQLFPTQSPSPRWSPAMSYDSVRGRTVLFGGSDSYNAFDDTWEWDGTQWSQPTPATSPPGRVSAALVFDEQRGRALLFGGTDLYSTLDDTWEWDGTTWSPLVATAVGRQQHAMVFDRARGRTVLFGGIDANRVLLGDTWEWDGTSWMQDSFAGAAESQVARDGVRPSPRTDRAVRRRRLQSARRHLGVGRQHMVEGAAAARFSPATLVSLDGL
jgi:hypothetical protein